MRSPDVMLRQVAALTTDLRDLTAGYAAQVRSLPLEGVRRVVLTGDGDSYFAALAAELAFETVACVDCDPLPALRFAEYGVDRLRRSGGADTLVVAISASGRTERVVHALDTARSLGTRTVAVTGNRDSPVARAADHAVIVALPDSEPSPGIRTYQASLVALLLIGGVPPAELAALAGLLASDVPAGELADAIAESGCVALLGSGPSHGTALFGAAKIIEAAGVLAVGQDLEEWCHVERFAYPVDMPVFVIAPAGRSRWRALRTAERAAELGRRTIPVVAEDDHEFDRYAWRTVRVPGAVREEFAPLLYHPFACRVAAALATRLGRGLFQT